MFIETSFLRGRTPAGCNVRRALGYYLSPLTSKRRQVAVPFKESKDTNCGRVQSCDSDRILKQNPKYGTEEPIK